LSHWASLARQKVTTVIPRGLINIAVRTNVIIITFVLLRHRVYSLLVVVVVKFKYFLDIGGWSRKEDTIQ